MLDLPLAVNAPPELLVLPLPQCHAVLSRNLIGAVDVQQVSLDDGIAGSDLGDDATGSDVLAPVRLDPAAAANRGSARGHRMRILCIQCCHGGRVAGIEGRDPCGSELVGSLFVRRWSRTPARRETGPDNYSRHSDHDSVPKSSVHLSAPFTRQMAQLFWPAGTHRGSVEFRARWGIFRAPAGMPVKTLDIPRRNVMCCRIEHAARQVG